MDKLLQVIRFSFRADPSQDLGSSPLPPLRSMIPRQSPKPSPPQSPKDESPAPKSPKAAAPGGRSPSSAAPAWARRSARPWGCSGLQRRGVLRPNASGLELRGGLEPGFKWVGVLYKNQGFNPSKPPRATRSKQSFLIRTPALGLSLSSLSLVSL